MTRLLGLLFAFWGSVSLATAEDAPLRPLSEVLADEQSEVMLLYATQRCAALFAVTVERMRKTPSVSEDEVKPWKEASDVFIRLSMLDLMTQQSIPADEASKITLNTILNISELYDSEMEHYYLRTGNSFNDKVMSDVMTCAELNKLISKRIEE